MMLKILLDNNQIDSETLVVFANTGREDNATLDFIHACSVNWGVPVIWLEYRKDKPNFEVVTYETASRRYGENNSRPFQELLESRKYLPNPVQRLCTGEMKIKTIKRYVRSLKHKGEIPTYVGLRYDEPTRVARKKEQNRSGKDSEYYYMPLHDMRITVKDRDAFWKKQGFDLQIHSQSDNCDLCFMKGMWQQVWKIREDPESVEWWIKMEDRARLTSKKKRHGQFRKEYSYRELKDLALRQTYMPIQDENQVSLTCSCTD